MARGVLLALTACLACGVARAGERVDGVYVGVRELTLTNNTAQCDEIAGKPARMVVRGGHFRVWWRARWVDVAVGADGRFGRYQVFPDPRGAPVLLQIKGRVGEGVFDADIGTQRCGLRLHLTKVT